MKIFRASGPTLTVIIPPLGGHILDIQILRGVIWETLFPKVANIRAGLRARFSLIRMHHALEAYFWKRKGPNCNSDQICLTDRWGPSVQKCGLESSPVSTNWICPFAFRLEFITVVYILSSWMLRRLKFSYVSIVESNDKIIKYYVTWFF